MREAIGALARDWRAKRLGHVIVAATIEKFSGWSIEYDNAHRTAADLGPVEAALLATYL